jgi:hypothetical protein
MAHRARLESKRTMPSLLLEHRRYQRQKLFVRRFGRRRRYDPTAPGANRSDLGSEREAHNFWQAFAPAELVGLRSRGERVGAGAAIGRSSGGAVSVEDSRHRSLAISTREHSYMRPQLGLASQDDAVGSQRSLARLALSRAAA